MEQILKKWETKPIYINLFYESDKKIPSIYNIGYFWYSKSIIELNNLIWILNNTKYLYCCNVRVLKLIRNLKYCNLINQKIKNNTYWKH